MGERWDDQEFEDVARLIREDEERALKIFRRRNFDQVLRARTAAVPEEKRGFFGRRMALPASVAALLLIAAAAVLLVTRRSTSSWPSGPGPMAEVLGGLPGISGLVMPRETVRAGETEAFGAAREVSAVLTMAARQKEEEERKAAFPPESLKAPRLSLEKKMEILFKDRAIERVLVRISRKSEEV